MNQHWNQAALCLLKGDNDVGRSPVGSWGDGADEWSGQRDSVSCVRNGSLICVCQRLCQIQCQPRCLYLFHGGEIHIKPSVSPAFQIVNTVA